MLNPITLVDVEIYPAPALTSVNATVFSDFKFAFALAPNPFPPVIVIIGSDKKSYPLSITSIESKEPRTEAVAVAPDPTESEIMIFGGLMIS